MSDDSTVYSGIEVVISAIIGIVVAVGSVWWVSSAGQWERLFRDSPTVEQGGIGADWIAGNTIPVLDFLIAITHAADVLMGAFILLIVFIHWGAFRRLAGKMRQQGSEETAGTGAARADGGQAVRDQSQSASDGGERE